MANQGRGWDRADRRVGHARAEVGVHAGSPRRGRRIPLAVVMVVVLALALWQALQFALAADTTTRASTGVDVPSTAAALARVRTVVSIGDAGALHVVETLSLGSAESRLDLSVPQRHGAGADFRPTISSLVVFEPQPRADSPVGPINVGGATTVQLASPATRVVLEYDASGVVVRSGDEANPERVLALMTPLVVAQAQGLPWTVEVQSVKVLNVGCLDRVRLSGCGTQTPDGWTVETNGAEDGRRPDVLAQLNLAVP